MAVRMHWLLGSLRQTDSSSICHHQPSRPPNSNDMRSLPRQSKGEPPASIGTCSMAHNQRQLAATHCLPVNLRLVHIGWGRAQEGRDVQTLQRARECWPGDIGNNHQSAQSWQITKCHFIGSPQETPKSQPRAWVAQTQKSWVFRHGWGSAVVHTKQAWHGSGLQMWAPPAMRSAAPALPVCPPRAW